MQCEVTSYVLMATIVQELSRLRLCSAATRLPHPFPRGGASRAIIFHTFRAQHEAPRRDQLCSDKDWAITRASRSLVRNIAGPSVIPATASSEGIRAARDFPLSPDPALGIHYRNQSGIGYASSLRSSIAGKPFIVGLGALRRACRVPMSGEQSSNSKGGSYRPSPPLRSYTPGPPDSSNNFLNEQISKQQRNNFHSTSLTTIKMVADSVNKTALHPTGVK